LPWFETTRVRAGFLTTPNCLLYGTGGVAYGNAELSDTFSNTINVPGIGWVAGIGAEYAMGRGWSLGAEYLHVSLSGPSATAGAISGNATTTADEDIGRAKVNYRF
jgi:outer membrane immunogenic protein